MSKINRHPVRRTAAGVLASALVFSGALAAAVPANAAVGFDLERVSGNDRYETSAAIAAAFGQSTNVILASGESGRTPDALAANFLAGVQNAPVLLTRRDTTPEPILDRLRALRAGGATTITVVGGPVAISDLQLTSLRSLGFTVNRVAGDNRYETAAAVAAAGEGATASNVGILASGVSTIDALAGGPLAFKGRHPIFLTTRDDIPGATVAGMRAAGITSVYVLGGTAVVGSGAIAELTAAGITVVARLAGDDRSETSVAIANELITNHGFSAATFNLAAGVNEGIDALGGAALSGKENRVLLITNTPTSAAPVTGFATARQATLNTAGRIFGGASVVAPTLETGVETAAGAGQGFQTLNVTPTDAVTLQLADDEGGTDATSDNRTYTVTGLDDALTYRITLVNAAGIGGTAAAPTFLSSAISPATDPATFAVDTGTDIADIIAVGGTSPAIGTTVEGQDRADTATVRPVNGSITFVIDGEATGTVVPAVYVNGGQGGTATTGGANNRLETGATTAGGFAAATETFGLGGPTTFINPAAASQVVAAGTVIDAVDKDANQFDIAGETFTYDANDSFRIAGVPVAIEQFEASLSSGDTIAANYSATGALSSAFDLADANPETPAAPTVAVADSNDVTVTATLAGDVDQVRFERATVTDTGVGTFAAVGTVAATGDTDAVAVGNQVAFVDNNLAAGTYAYRVVFINDGDAGDESPATQATATTPAAADTTAPTVVDTRVEDNAGSAFLLEVGDSFQLFLSEVIETAEAGDTIRVQDADGTIVDFLEDPATADFDRNNAPIVVGTTTFAAGQVLSVRLEATDRVVAEGTQGGLALPATVTAIAGTSDAANNTVAVTGSADLVIDGE